MLIGEKSDTRLDQTKTPSTSFSYSYYMQKKVLMNLRKLKKFHEQLFRVNRGLDQEADMAPRNEDMVEVIFFP